MCVFVVEGLRRSTTRWRVKSRKTKWKFEWVNSQNNHLFHFVFTSTKRLFSASTNRKQTHETANRQLGKGARNRLLECIVYNRNYVIILNIQETATLADRLIHDQVRCAQQDEQIITLRKDLSVSRNEASQTNTKLEEVIDQYNDLKRVRSAPIFHTFTTNSCLTLHPFSQRPP